MSMQFSYLGCKSKENKLEYNNIFNISKQIFILAKVLLPVRNTKKAA